MPKGTLLYPELIRQTPQVGIQAELAMRNRVHEAITDSCSHDALGHLRGRRISVVLRTLNERGTLGEILNDIEAQEGLEEVEIIVVDNASSDGTPELARERGATVVNLPRGEFTYPKSMNLGVDAASHDNVFLSVGHVNFSNNFLLAGAARHFETADTGGVFNYPLLGRVTSRTERAIWAFTTLRSIHRAERLDRAIGGILGATNCMISKEIWEELGRFDEAYESGGEDSALAKRMLANGLSIVRDPVIAVHHTHGLGPINFSKQLIRWVKSANPQPINSEKIVKSRPDLNFS